MVTMIHPGKLVREKCLQANGLGVRDAAAVLGVTRQALNNLVNGHAGISAEMAVRLEKAFGGSAASWVQLQASYDLEEVQQRADGLGVKPFGEAASEEQARLL
jgi:antitoxin HigA-1